MGSQVFVHSLDCVHIFRFYFTLWSIFIQLEDLFPNAHPVVCGFPMAMVKNRQNNACCTISVFDSCNLFPFVVVGE